jgi:VCBS repeat-containing protein
MGRLNRILIMVWLPLLGFTATYRIGPGGGFETINDFPIELLAAGDVLEILARDEPYSEKFVLAVRGTAAAPVIIRGIPDADGNLPIFDGTNATTRTQLSFGKEHRGIIVFNWAAAPWLPPPGFDGYTGRPAHIIVENLHFRNAYENVPFTNDEGKTTWDEDGSAVVFTDNASGIHIEIGEDITIRNCILEGCGNGIFSAHDSHRITIEGCHFTGNGTVGSIFQHNSYTESHGVTIQYNHYEPLRAGALGNNVKDRSSDMVVRYNWIEGGNRQLDLVDSSQASIYAAPGFQHSYVYGNTLIENNDGNKQMVHYGGDQPDHTGYRTGTLHFYHNTVVSERLNESTVGFRMQDTGLVIGRNNIFHSSLVFGMLAGESGAGTRVQLFDNWLPSNVSLGSKVTGTGNHQGSDPGFVDAANQNFLLRSNAASLDEGGTVVVPAAQNAIAQYQPHLRRLARHSDATADLGAFEYYSIDSPAIANDDSYIVSENRSIEMPALTGILANDFRDATYPPQTVVLDPPNFGQVEIAADGAFTYRPNAHYTGADNFQYALVEIPPSPINFVAADPESPDEFYSAGDTLTVSFDRPTDTPGGGEPHARGVVDSLFSFGEFNIGSDYQGSWINSSSYEIRIVDPAGAHVPIGAISATPVGTIPIRNAGASSDGATAPSPVLKGAYAITRMTWTNQVRVTVDGHTLSGTNSGGWAAGASSNERILYPTGLSHYVQWIIDGTYHVMAGLNDNDTQTHFGDIDFAAYTNGDNGNFQIREKGIEQRSPSGSSAFGTYSAGDTVRIETDGTYVRYLVNGELRHTSSRTLTPSDFPFVFDVSLNTNGASISNAVTNSAQSEPEAARSAIPIPRAARSARAFADTAIVSFTISAESVPVGESEHYKLLANGNITIPAEDGVLANDVGTAGQLQARTVTNPSHGSLSLNANGAFHYVAQVDYTGFDYFVYEPYDNAGDGNPVVVSIRIGNQAPIASDDDYAMDEDSTLVRTVSNGFFVNDSDPDFDSLTLVPASVTQHGSLTHSPDGAFTYVPVPDFHGSDTFLYRVADDFTNSNPATVTFRIANVNDIPVGNPEVYETDEDIALTGNVITNDTDADNETLSADLVTDVAHGSLNLAPSGAFTYQPTLNYFGADSFQYRAQDAVAESAIVTVGITVESVNDIPVAAPESYSVLEDGVLVVPAPGVLQNDSDVETANLAAAPRISASSGSVTLAASGAFTYTPSGDFSGIATFSYIAFDGVAESAPATVSITVNSPPVITLLGNPLPRVPAGFPYHDAGAIALDVGDGNISGDIVVSGVVDTNVPNTYFLDFDVVDSGGLAAVTVTRSITVTGSAFDQDISLSRGWNLISIPGPPLLRLAEMMTADCADLNVFSQQGGVFTRVDPSERLQPGKAYWIFASRPCQLNVVYDQPVPVTVDLPGGEFSLVGPINAGPWPGPEMPRSIWSWEGRFRALFADDVLQPFRGYIIYLDTGGEFTLQ